MLDLLMQQKASQKYQTNLDPAQQMQFADWASKNNVPVDLSNKSDYDMPGFFKSMQAGGEASPSVSELDSQPHFTDKYKTPEHETFSNESKYAGPDASHWEGNALKSPEGELTGLELPDDNILKIKKDALKKYLGK